VQADAGVLVDQLAHALEISRIEAELLFRAVNAHGVAQGGEFGGGCGSTHAGSRQGLLLFPSVGGTGSPGFIG
jgi:hypothetical protein